MHGGIERGELLMPTGSAFLSTLEQDDPSAADFRAAALEAGDALAERVVAVARRAAAGGTLTEAEERILFYGHFILADRSERALYAPLMRILRTEGTASGLFTAPVALDLMPAVVVAVFDGDPAPLAETLLDPATGDEVRMALLAAIPELVGRGALDRTAAESLLDRVGASAVAAIGSAALIGWVEAVITLEMQDLLAAARERWTRQAAETEDPELRSAILQLVGLGEFASAEAAADGEEPLARPPFDDDRPLAERVAAILERGERRAALHVPTAGIDADDPAEEIALDEDEEAWFVDFLEREDLPATAMDLEMLDGYCTGRAITGAKDAPTWQTVVLGKRPETLWRMRNGADLDRLAAFADRMDRAVRMRFAAGLASEPLFYEPGGDAGHEGQNWCSGCLEGLLGRRTLEELKETDPELTELIQPMLHLAGYYDPLTQQEAEAVADVLPALTLGIYRELQKRGTRDSKAATGPAGVAKVGRNEPCPCGSGRKYKYCCGKS